jgi:hypothetical protein
MPILGANSRPEVVAAKRAISGFIFLITCAKIDENGRTRYSSSLSFSTRITSSEPCSIRV